MNLHITKEELATLIGDKVSGAAALISGALATECNKMNVKIEKLSQQVVTLTTTIDDLTKENARLKEKVESLTKEDRENNASLIATSTGLFSQNLSPFRGVLPFGVIDSRRKGPNGEVIYRTDIFAWNHLKLLSDKVLRDMGENPMTEDAAPFIPLRACVGYWGADQLLNRFWQKQSNKVSLK
jgi:outer membrane murein-binding lipoprotein Lpp